MGRWLRWRTAAGGGGETLISERVVDDADERPVTLPESDTYRDLRDSVDEIHRAVEGIDDPEAPFGNRAPAFLRKDLIVRPVLGDDGEHNGLGGMIGRRHGVELALVLRRHTPIETVPNNPTTARAAATAISRSSMEPRD